MYDVYLSFFVLRKTSWITLQVSSLPGLQLRVFTRPVGGVPNPCLSFIGPANFRADSAGPLHANLTLVMCTANLKTKP